MRRVALLLAFCAALLLGQEHGAGAKEHAEEAAAHGEEHANSNEIWWKWANFAILFGGLAWLARKYGAPYFNERATAIRESIASSRQLKADAEARAAEIERKIASLGVEVENLRRGAREEMAAESARLQAETESQIAKIQARAEAEIAAAGKTASLDLKAWAAQLAVQLAEEQLRQRLTPSDQAGLIRSFVDELEQKSNGKASRN